MKFVIFALVAFFVGLAKSAPAEEEETFDQEDVESLLHEMFELTPDDLKKECNVDFGSEWTKIGAALEKVHEMTDDLDTEAAAHFKGYDSIFGERVFADCRQSEPFKKEVMNAIKIMLPCAKEDRVSELVQIAEMNIC